MDDDAHPGIAEAPARKCVKEDTANDIPQDTPGLVNMVEAMEHAVCHPAPLAKYSIHLGQLGWTRSRATKGSCCVFLASANLDVYIWGPEEAAEVSHFFTYASGDASRY